LTILDIPSLLCGQLVLPLLLLLIYLFVIEQIRHVSVLVVVLVVVLRPADWCPAIVLIALFSLLVHEIRLDDCVSRSLRSFYHRIEGILRSAPVILDRSGGGRLRVDFSRGSASLQAGEDMGFLRRTGQRYRILSISNGIRRGIGKLSLVEAVAHERELGFATESAAS